MTVWPAHLLRHNTFFLALALLMFTGALWPVPINHDSAFLFLAGERLIDGQSLYLDQNLVSPPLGYWMHAGAVFIDRWAGPVGVHILLPLTVLIVALSLLLGARVLALDPALDATQRAGLLWAGFATLALAPLADFGQRDHLFAVFAFPYVLLLGLRFNRLESPPALALAVGVFAFFGLALKPHFLLLPLVLEGALLIRGWRWMHLLRTETVALGACLVLYALSVVAFYPEYFSTVLPRYTKVFFAFTQPLAQLLVQFEVTLAVAAIVAFMYERRHVRFGYGIVLALLIATVAGVMIFLLQKKGWSYQRAPVLMFSTMLVFSLAILCGKPKSLFVRPSRLLVWASLVGVALMLAARGPYDNVHQDHAAKAMAELARGHAAYVFTTNVSVPYPTFLYQDVTPASRFNTLWMIPALARADTQELAPSGPIERFARDAILQDFQRYKPQVVGVDVRARKPYFNGVAFDYLNWALKDPRFGAEWKHYERVQETAGFAIYVRKPASR